jgi:hypothetical protein
MSSIDQTCSGHPRMTCAGLCGCGGMEGKKHDLHLRILLPASRQVRWNRHRRERRISWWLILCESARAKVPNNVTLQLGRSSSLRPLLRGMQDGEDWHVLATAMLLEGIAVVCGQCLLTQCSCIAHLVDMQGHTTGLHQMTRRRPQSWSIAL